MESVRNARRKLAKHFKKTDEPFYNHSIMSSDQIFNLEWRHIQKRFKKIEGVYEGAAHNIPWLIN